jgi:dipeptidyl aminopeptidase/acylaminoacyl peptidase
LKPNNLIDYRKISNITSNDKNIVAQSTKMDFDENTYKNELWRYSKNTWKKFKGSKANNFSMPQYSNNKKVISYIKSTKKSKKITMSSLCIQSGNSITTVFETEDTIQNYYWASKDNFIYIVTKEWDKSFKSIDDKEMEPLYLENIPYRFDTRGIIFNKRNHLYKVNVSNQKCSKIIDGDKEGFISIGSIVEKESSLYFTASSYNESGSMLDEKIIKKTGNKLETIHTEGMWGKLFIFNNELHGIGLNKRFEWPTNISIHQIKDTGKTSVLYQDLDRPITNVKCIDSFMYILYEDSGKQLLGKGDGKNIEILIDDQLTISDFEMSSDRVAVIANTFSKQDEIYELKDGKIEDWENTPSKANSSFHRKTNSYECVYKRIDTGKSKIDAWGIFVGKNNPTLLSIHGGPAAQYGFNYFDEFQTYAEAGFNVIACNPRGSSGRGHKFLRDVCGNKWGVNDTHDVVTTFKEMIKELKISNKNYGIMGGSYGGFMTAWVISHYPKMFKSSVVERALLNWETMVGTSDIGITFPEMYLLEEFDKNINLYRKKSPITYANNIIAPTLIIHSENDYRCPIEQGEQLFSNLKRRGVESAMMRFPAESHELSRSGQPVHRKQRFEAIINWHKKHLT